MIRKWLLRILFGGDLQSYTEMVRIADECSKSCERTLKREVYLIGRYGAIVERENQILDAVKNSYDLQLKSRIVEILKEESRND